MAWVFEVETGEGLASATSYVSVADASDYYTPDTAAFATWDALTNDQQQYLLSWSTRVLDQKVEWRGCPSTDTQNLRWPRSGVRNRDGALIEDDVIPPQLVEIVCEMAKYLITNDPTTQQDVEHLSRLKVDVIEIEWQEGTSQITMPSFLGGIVYPLGSMRTGGIGFPRIRKS